MTRKTPRKHHISKGQLVKESTLLGWEVGQTQ